jgi:hypothetical protein
MNIEILHNEIKTFNDFLLGLNLVISNTGLLCFKNYQDANSINTSSKPLLDYYKREKNKIIDKIHNYSKVYRIEFKDWSVNFDEQYDKLLEEVKEIYFSDKENDFTIKKTLSNELTICFKEVVNSIWIAYYNSKIEELETLLNINKKIEYKIFYDNGFEHFKYLTKNFKGATPTIKLTAIYNVLLRFNKIRDNQNLYKDFIVNDFSSELEVGSKTLKFSRFADTTADSYTSTYDKLIILIENKFKTHNN